MKCKNCGEKLKGDEKFCEICGLAITPKTSRHKRVIIGTGIGIIALLVVVTTFLGLGYRKSVKEKNNLQVAQALKVEEMTNDQLLEMQEILNLEDSIDEYIITDTQRESYYKLLKKLEMAIENQDINDGEKILDQLNDLKSAFIQNSTNTLSEKMSNLEAIDLTSALHYEKLMIEEYAREIDELQKQQKYLSANELAGQWEQIVHMIEESDKGSLHIAQIDVKAYPKVKLYLQIQDLITGNSMVIDRFDQFSIMENINGSYKKQAILNAVQLNEKEKLNINLTADISGSMRDEFDHVKNVMKSFLNEIQFDIGDRASLITFDNNIYMDVDFTSVQKDLSNAITNMELGNMTALYDALYVAVSTTSMQTGAKCVMAFTDGYDNYSSRTVDDVIGLAQFYKIPVFIIGIGQNIDASALSHLADSTGGFYRNVNSGVSMEAIYNEIYRQQKELYVLEYETDQSLEKIEERQVYVAYQDDTLPMRNETKFIAQDLMEEPEDYKKLINQSMMTSQDVEAEILRIRAIWNGDREAMKNKQYQVTQIANGIKAYSSNKDIRMIEIQRNINGMDYARTYNFSNGQLIFAYIEKSDAHRLYFKDDRLFRWRYTVDANKRDQAINHDNMGDSEEFNRWGAFALDEAEQVYSDTIKEQNK